MLRKLGTVAMSGTALGGKAAVASIRSTMPMLEFYSGTTRAKESEVAAEDEAAASGNLVKLGFNPGEAGVLRKAFAKGMLEAMEISSVTHPLYKDAPVYRAVNPETGAFSRPTLANFLSLGIAAAAIWRDWSPGQPKPDQDAPQVFPLGQTVAYVTTRPGEYRYVEAPLAPSEIRRFAMRQRSISTPQPAMLLRSSDPRSIAPASTAAMSVAAPQRMPRNMSATSARPASAAHAASGCGCGSSGGCDCGKGSSCSCGGHGTHVFPPARYEEDGSCGNWLTVSCETRWRVRECFKIAFCDLLRCMGEELCEKEERNLSDCFGDFLCSLLTCLPEAICPPPDTCEPCCHPAGHAIDCHCNFAVGE